MGVVSTFSLLSFDESIFPSWWNSQEGDLWQLSSSWRICLWVDKESSEKASPWICCFSSAQNNQYAWAAFVGVARSTTLHSPTDNPPPPAPEQWAWDRKWLSVADTASFLHSSRDQSQASSELQGGFELNIGNLVSFPHDGYHSEARMHQWINAHPNSMRSVQLYLILQTRRQSYRVR